MMHVMDSVRRRGAGTGLLLAVVLAAGCASAPSPGTPGTGSRTLSPQEVNGLLAGHGMSMAAAAEINGYPGPQHVLELKEELGLTPDQRFATSRLVGLVLGQARALGQRVVDAEKRLDEDLARGDLRADQVRARLETIATLRSQLRFTHINAHIEQKKILTPEQIRRYYELRGRKVVLGPPAAPPMPTEPLTLPAPAAAPAPVTPPAPAVAAPVLPDVDATAPALPVQSTPRDMQDAQPVGEPAEAPRLPEPETLAPGEPAKADVMSAPMEKEAPAMTPGMQDALPDAQPAEAPPPEPETARQPPAYPLTPLKETRPRALTPTPVLEQEPETETPAMTPGMQDALPEAEPAPDVTEPTREPAYPLTPLEETPPRALAPAPEKKEPEKEEREEQAPAMTPGMRDALPEAEPLPPATPQTERAPMSPGVQDAMEFAEPAPPLPVQSPDDSRDTMELAPAAPASELRIPPLEDGSDYELKELEPIESAQPASVELDN